VERDRRARERQSKERGLEKRAQELEKQNDDLTRRLASAHGALDAYRKETRRLKDDLERVRGSRSMRLGRALTKPASLLRRSGAGDAESPAQLPEAPSSAPVTSAAKRSSAPTSRSDTGAK